MNIISDASVNPNDSANTIENIQMASQDHTFKKHIVSKSVLGLISLFMQVLPILIVILSWTQQVRYLDAHDRVCAAASSEKIPRFYY